MYVNVSVHAHGMRQEVRGLTFPLLEKGSLIHPNFG